MNRARARWFLGSLVALLIGCAVTLLGFAIQSHQMRETYQRQSVAPLLNSRTNLEIMLCQPILALGQRLGADGFPAFLMLFVGNVLFWAALVLLIARIVFRWTHAGGLRAPAA